MPLSEEAQQLAALLLALTQPDTQGIRNAEAALKPLLKDPRCVPALIEILKARNEQSDAVRQIASVVLRKRLPGHYIKFDASTQTQLKSEILSILSSEPERTVRKGVVNLAASILKVAPQEWPEVWSFLAAASRDAHPDARELAFWLLAEMTDTVGEHLKSHFQELSHLFAKGLQDEDPKVQKAAVKALGQLMSYLAEDAEIDIFANLIPSLLQVAASCAQNHDEDTVAVVLDVLYDLTFSPSAALTQYLHDITSFGLLCMSCSDLDIRVRDSGALIVATLAEARPKIFGRDQVLVTRVLDTLFALIENSPSSAAGALFESNPAWRDDLEETENDDEFDDSPTETSMAQGTLDMIACEVPKKYIFEPIVQRCIMRLSSPNAMQRKAGIAGLGVIAEGCNEPLREHLSDVMPLVFQAAGDAEAQVRECACFALGQLSEHCRPEILGYSSQILPIVFQLLDDTTVTVQATSCYVLEMFCERLEPEAVRPLLDQLVRKLAAMLETSNKRSVQEMAVAALAATAVAAEDEFGPYVSGVADLMQKLMVLNDESLYSLRGRALECMGHMAIAVGKEGFEPYFVPTMQCALEGLATDSTDLHEFAYAVFANLAKVMGLDFAPALNDLVPHLIQVIGSDEGELQAVKGPDEVESYNALDDSDDEDGEDGNYVLHVRTALLETKKGAITALGEMAAHTGAAFSPFLEDSLKVLQKAGTNWHPLIKTEVADALPSMVEPSIAAYDGGEIKWTKGEMNGSNPMSPQTTVVSSAVLKELVELMSDDDKDVVGKACEGIQSVIELCGPHSLVPVLNDVLQKTHDLLNKKAPCQLSADFFGEATEDDDDHDTFMQSVCDLLGSFPRVMGPHFAQHLPKFLVAVLDYSKSSRPPSDRSMAFGCLSELAQESGREVAPHWESVFFRAILAGLGDPDDNVKRNAVFCAGVCCESLGDSIADKYPQLLQSISPLFSVDTSNGEASAACVDNAAAALSRMIIACPNQVPMGQVLPVLLKALPLKSDTSEYPTVFKCLLGLMQANHPDLVANKDELRRVFTEAISDGSEVPEEIQAQIQPALQSF